MDNLTPLQTASLSEDVYALSKIKSLEEAYFILNNKYKNQLSFGEDALLKGKTGGPWFIKSRTAFGFTLLGKGAFQGQAFFIFRGTQYLADWLTNLNLSTSRSISGQPIHDGFNRAFKTMLPGLQEFMRVVNKNNIRHIHCIGHSLGGALATLCGDWIKSAHGRTPFIYTYGSPRVGLYGFANHCTSTVGAERIFRTYHKTDIVPCIPTWPFMHTPDSGRDYYLPSPGIVPMAEYHGMDRYLESVRGKSWIALASLRPEHKSDEGIINWLESRSPIGLTITSLKWLNQALEYVLKKCLKGAAMLISSFAGTSFTLMDRLAYILCKGIDLSKNISSLVVSFIRKIMEILGMRRTLQAVDLTKDFIRSALLTLQGRINMFTHSVLSKVLVDGRAI